MPAQTRIIHFYVCLGAAGGKECEVIMATKTANVTARIQPNIKEQAEAILDRLGIPVSVFIDMTYRQVIMRDGVPFSLDIPDKLVTRDSITQAEFDTMMQTGLAQAKKNDSVSVDEAFSQLKSKI